MPFGRDVPGQFTNIFALISCDGFGCGVGFWRQIASISRSVPLKGHVWNDSCSIFCGTQFNGWAKPRSVILWDHAQDKNIFWKCVSEPKTLVGLDNSATRQTADPTKSIWHGAFIRGARRRMGDTVSPDLGISIEVLLALLMLLEDEWNETNALEEQTEVVEVAFMCVVSFMLALRGNEIMIIHLGGLIEYLDKSTQDPKLPHVLVTLKGRLKGDMIDRYHAMPMAIISASGIKGELWTRRFVETRARQGVTTGYAFRRPDGSPARATDYEPGLHSRLCELVSTVGHLLPKLEDIEEKIRFRRSFRRGSNTRAQIKNVPTNVINAVARWSDKERSRGVDVHRLMQEHYLEMKSALPIILSYSGSL